MKSSEPPEWWRSGGPSWTKRHYLSNGSGGGDHATKVLVKACQLKPGMQVLDIASGFGDPAMTLAEGVGPQGRVIATDQAFKSVKTAREIARADGLANLRFQQVDAHALPFSDRTFDVVTCRFAVMQFRDVGQAAREILRVLKPDGKVLFLVRGAWEREENSMCILQIMKKHNIKYGEGPPGRRHRFADPKPLLDILKKTGFRRAKADFHEAPEVWLGTLEEYLELMCDSPWGDREQIRDEILMNMRQHCGGEEMNFKKSIILVSARKASEKAEKQIRSRSLKVS